MSQDLSATRSDADRRYRRVINAWAMYDWANSAFATTISAAVLPPFAVSLARNAGLSENTATAYWGYTNAFSMLLIAVLGPVLGTLSDLTGARKRFLTAFAALGVLASAGLTFAGRDSYVLVCVLFVAGGAGFAAGNIFYESLLPHIARPGDLDRVSARGYAFGYIGGGLLLVLNALWIAKPHWFFFPDRATAVRGSFLSVAVWWAVFTLPLLWRVPEPAATAAGLSAGRAIGNSFRQLGRTLHAIGQYRHLALFLGAFWIYNDGISTIIKMATVYGKSIGIGETDMILALVITQFIGVPCAFAFAALAGRIGTKAAILIGVGVYALISILGFFMREAWHFYLLAILVGLVQGGTQALSRSLFASMVPKHQTAEFFGFYSTGAKFAGILGPLLFGAVSQSVGSRWGIVSIILFFVVGGGLLLRVNVADGVRVAREAEVAEAGTPQPP